MRLLLVRIPVARSALIARSLFGRVPGVDVRAILELSRSPDSSLPFPFELVPGKAVNVDLMREKIALITKGFRPDLAMIWTPLFGLAETAAAVLRKQGVDVMWVEDFFDGKVILDRIGCQYTEKSELKKYLPMWRSRIIRFPVDTRFAQPSGKIPRILYRRYGGPNRTVVVFGQVPRDMALKETRGRIPYLDWLSSLFEANPKTLFLFKHHPAAKTDRKILKDRENVIEIKESIKSLFRAYYAFASWSSTTIIQGALVGAKFAAEGRHFLDDERLVVRTSPGAGMRDIYRRIVSFKPDPDLMSRALSFVTTRYAVHPASPLFVERITSSSEKYFSGAGGG